MRDANERLRLMIRAWKYRVKLDPAEVAYARRKVRPGDTAIDLGAHKGAYSCWLARGVGPTGTLVMIEPQRELADGLERLFGATPGATSAGRRCPTPRGSGASRSAPSTARRTGRR